MMKWLKAYLAAVGGFFCAVVLMTKLGRHFGIPADLSASQFSNKEAVRALEFPYALGSFLLAVSFAVVVFYLVKQKTFTQGDVDFLSVYWWGVGCFALGGLLLPQLVSPEPSVVLGAIMLLFCISACAAWIAHKRRR